MSSRLERSHGNIDFKALSGDVLPLTTTGDLHVAVYDYADDALYVSTAAPPSDGAGDADAPVEAYNRPYIGFALEPLFSLAPPKGARHRSVSLK
mmetsp:Transcript_13370/g.44045  ORF Transcript_13370/g.44045 Transcript_13370/m.44045 type:complete len:94 (+) Transcript_13370:1197-1478(+)